MKKINKKGFTLIELLIVITVFVVISLITSQAIILTLVGTHKSETISKVRQNLDFAVESMERQLHNAQSISQCPNVDPYQLSFTDQNDQIVTFSCVNVNNNNQASYIASSSAALTSSDIYITNCSFTCTPGNSSSPPYVTIDVTAKQLVTSGNSSITGGTNNAEVKSSVQVTLRSY